VIEGSPLPVTRAGIVADLRSLGIVDGSVLVVHSKLSAIGWVLGGAQAVVEALLDAVGPAGTVTMPGHSGDWSEPSHWHHPPVPEAWWPIIRAEMPAFDVHLTPCREMGRVVEAFRQHSSTVRSNHPTVSHLANGPRSAEVTRHHPLADGFGPASPLGRLYDLDATVVLLGVGHANNTSLHLAEQLAWGDEVPRIAQGTAMTVDGERRWVTFDEAVADSDDFEEAGSAFAATGHERVGTVGGAVTRVMPLRALVDFAEPWFRARRSPPR